MFYAKTKKDTKSYKIPILITKKKLNAHFLRGRKTARLLDKNMPVQPSRIISFEDIRDLTNLLTSKKLKLVAAVRKKPSSITVLAKKLKRNRTAIEKDVQRLASVGIIKSEHVANSRHKFIMATDEMPIKLQAEIII